MTPPLRALSRTLCIAVPIVVATLGAGCSSDSPERVDQAAFAPCPSDAVSIVVTVDPWTDIVEQLAGGCGDVRTIVEGSVGDPHDYELTPADTAAFTAAELVVMNGLGYDHWAEDALEARSTRPAVVDAGDVAGLVEGDNPHIWYGPEYVEQVARAITATLQTLAPAAQTYLDARAQEWSLALEPYRAEIAAIRSAHAGAPYAATESVFDYLAAALGLVDVTPPGYRTAAANESEPGPRDLHDFLQVLGDHRADVLIYNVQTEGSGPQQIRAEAESAGVPVVEVTETPPAAQPSFVAWQLDQLRALRDALSGNGSVSR